MLAAADPYLGPDRRADRIIEPVISRTFLERLNIVIEDDLCEEQFDHECCKEAAGAMYIRSAMYQCGEGHMSYQACFPWLNPMKFSLVLTSGAG